MQANAPVFVRIFKKKSELEVWKQREDGRYYHFKTYPICNWSGEVGPKQSQGDKPAPKGFYTITPTLMNPNSRSLPFVQPRCYPNAHDGPGPNGRFPSWCTGTAGLPAATR